MADIDYEKLADRLTDAAIPLPRPTHVATGDQAAAEGRAFLVREYGSEQALEVALRRGRPRLGATAHGGSPTVRGRISDAEYEAFKELEARTGKRQSELVREAVHLLLAEHRAGA